MQQPPQVYVVVSGADGAARVLGVFTLEAAAEQFIAGYNHVEKIYPARLERYPLDPEPDQLPPAWVVILDRSGETIAEKETVRYAPSSEARRVWAFRGDRVEGFVGFGSSPEAARTAAEVFRSREIRSVAEGDAAVVAPQSPETM